jgi:hypothetical protein
MFWRWSRQYLKDRREERLSGGAKDMHAMLRDAVLLLCLSLLCLLEGCYGVLSSSHPIAAF